MPREFGIIIAGHAGTGLNHGIYLHGAPNGMRENLNEREDGKSGCENKK